ncbi:putative succinate-semialdehyde dehydrogenase [NADP(+)] [Fusarium oxysporum]|uniref:Putative succinate-semialdehyde dehydrogenase [NADP(+)] n=1 Tax=Fusarium oxysporum TaxID=5507 RepID=A0A420MIS9_FUSOX|nr:putative succinate-semialdehyde dehydrogenase [NADP(+)] [Fusarium oxysporum]
MGYLSPLEGFRMSFVTDTKNNKDPGTGKVWYHCNTSTAADVPAAVESSHAAFRQFGKTTPRQRADWLWKWHFAIQEAKEDLATILTHESGKPLAESRGEIDYALGFTRWFAGEAERVFGELSIPSAPNRRAIALKQPIGVAVALVPWNFPISMVLRKAAAALAAGCTIIVKPSPETPLTALALGKLALKAGFLAGVLNVLTPDNANTPDLTKALCEHPLVKKVTFTGSTPVGKLISLWCAPSLKKLTLELGGNCPFIVFEDADLDAVADQLMALKWRNAGQACISANRAIVQDSVYEKFAEIVLEKTKRLSMGCGSDPKTNFGPLTTPKGPQRASELVENAKAHGGRIVYGGQAPTNSEGYFFNPTIILDATKDMDIGQQESFCPVLGLFKFSKEEEALAFANSTSMGLASYVFTQDVDRLWRMFENLEAGMIGLNTGHHSAAELQFGGTKDSGYGKEGGKDVSVAEYLITKSGTFTLRL